MKAYKIFTEDYEGYVNVFKTVSVTQRVAARNLMLEYQKISAVLKHSENLENIVARFMAYYNLTAINLVKPKNKKLLAVFGGEKGLTGGLYTKLARFVKGLGLNEIVLIGRASERHFEEEGLKPTEVLDLNPFDNILSNLFSKFEAGYDIDLVYSDPITLSTSNVIVKNIFSINFDETILKTSPGGIPILASKMAKIQKQIVRQIFIINLKLALIKSQVSEFSARTLAMEKAQSKTQEIMEKLKLDYFKSRRFYVTQRQLEGFLSHKRI